MKCITICNIKIYWQSFICGLLLLTCHSLSAQNFNLKNYNTSDGLSQSYVYTINQGVIGRLWLGTGDGLSGFDGANFNNYSQKNNLAENFVTASYLDKDGNIWFGHYQGGLSKYDNHVFETISKNIFASPINVINKDEKGNLWLGSQSNGLQILDNKNNLLKISNIYDGKSITDIHFIGNQKALISTNEGLDIINYGGLKLKVETHYLDYVTVNKLLKYKDNSYLVSTTDEGLFSINLSTATPILKAIKSDIDLTQRNWNAMVFDQNNYLWLSSYGEGIFKFTVADTSIINLNQISTANGLSNNYIKTMFTDKEGNVWLGTFGNGIEMVKEEIFSFYDVKSGLISNSVKALATYKNNFWIAAEQSITQVVFKKYRQNDEWNKKIFQNFKDDFKITTIVALNEHILYLGTEQSGIYLLDTRTEVCKKWYYNDNSNLSNRINHLNIDRNGNIWAATEDGVYLFNPQYNYPVIHLTMESGLLHNNVLSTFADRNNTIWFATHGSGISSYKNEKIVNYQSPNKNASIDINSFCEDKNGNIWIATYGQGIYKMSNNKVVKKYTQKDGLSSNFSYQIICDSSNTLWIGHRNAITKFNIKEENCIAYNTNNKLPINDLTNNAIGQDFESNIWFGSNKGLMKYNIGIDKYVKVDVNVVISSIDLFYENVDWGMFSDSLYTLAKLPFGLTLSHNQNHLTFHVHGVTFNDIEHVKYQYKLEGYEKEWSLVTNEDFVTYPNLPAGNYIFQVKSYSADGNWTSQPTTFNFSVLNPFWKTWWFITLTTLLLLIVFVIILKVRISSLEQQRQILQNEKIKLEAEIAERIKAEDKLKESEERLKDTNKELNTFVYRASHDLRGPLATVKGLTNLAKMEIVDADAIHYFSLISDRINRLDLILKDLINIVEIAEVALHIRNINMKILVEDIINTFASLPKSLTISLNIDEQLTLRSDKKIVEIVITNILDNAFKYHQSERSENIVVVTVIEEHNGVLINVKDNGMGILLEIQSRIFDMFFRGTASSTGSGLGLYLVKKIIQRLNGRVSVESNVNQGTDIQIFIPNAPEGIDEIVEVIHLPQNSME